MPLTDFAIKNAKAEDKPRKLSDFDGLYLYVTPQGSRLWPMESAFRTATGTQPCQESRHGPI
jgi:hypothetical protein